MSIDYPNEEKEARALGQTKKIAVVVLFVASVLTACGQTDVEFETTDSVQQELSETDKKVATLKSKYSATDFHTKDTEFSAEIIDNYKGQNLYISVMRIDDVFYSDDELFMYILETMSDEHFLLKITPEQYSVIQSLHNDFFATSLHIVFKLDNIEPLIPAMTANFYLDIRNTDDISTDEDSYLSLGARIIKGELIDILEIPN